jgi:predicted Rossmann fold nucleotide-binding protein DprA/Smf involved in DNA uptake
MQLNDNSPGILLLTTHFSRSRKSDPNPLTPTEYGRFSRWLHQNDQTPASLLSDVTGVAGEWSDPKGKITLERIEYLMGRGAAMGLALEKWNSAGIWVLTRADEGYPKRLRDALGPDAPAVFFGVGNPRLLVNGGLAMVGSRSIDDADVLYTRRVAQTAAGEGLNVVSGGARGVDETSMLAALEIGGTAVGVLANGLLSAALSGKWRPHLKKDELCLISPYYPEASFHVGNAMGRNKYIYCLADYGLVVRSDKGKGGTWSGATEALKKGLAPVFVNASNNAPGHSALVDLGALYLTLPPKEDEGGKGWLLATLRDRQASASSEGTPGAAPQADEDRPVEEGAQVSGDQLEEDSDGEGAIEDGRKGRASEEGSKKQGNLFDLGGQEG